jgi:hypothetical protein
MATRKKPLPLSNLPASPESALLTDIRGLVESSHQRVAVGVNAELSLLYWSVGKRINDEILGNERAEYGKQIVVSLARQLTTEYGKGWSEQHLRHCAKFAYVFPSQEILSTLWRELSWSHIKELLYFEGPLKRDFYIEMCKQERWSVRLLRERMDSMLYERTAISKKPEQTIKNELTHARLESKEKTWGEA